MPRKPVTKNQLPKKTTDSQETPLQILLQKAKTQKAITQKDISEALPDGGLDVEAADALIAQLVENGIEVLDEDDDGTESLADVDEPDDADLKQVEEELMAALILSLKKKEKFFSYNANSGGPIRYQSMLCVNCLA